MRSSQTLIIGRKPVLEALEQYTTLDRVLLQADISGELVGDILRAAKKNSTPIQRVPTAKLNALSKQNHQGVIALGALVEYQKLQDVIDFVVQEGNTPRFVYVDGVSDVRNIGAIARTALCYGFDGIILSERNNASINEDAVKSSAGAVLQIPIIREKHNEGILQILNDNGIAIYASSLQATETLDEMDFSGPCAVVLGSEESGISLQVQRACTKEFIIPMSTKFDSLNVSVAAGVICNAVYRANN
jgi:23S rRNA (guanosine2251-2'-O)-methyltransferase